MKSPTEASLRCIADVRAQLGEGPVWDADEQALYWIDIRGQKLFRLKNGGGVTEWPTPFLIGSLASLPQGGFLAATDKGLALVDVETGSFEVIADPEHDLPGNRFNDGKIDRHGRFWIGSMDDAEQVASGALYRVDGFNRWTRIDDGYRVTNGPAFSPDGSVMYVNDSAVRITYAYDVDEKGNASNKRVFARYDDSEGYPDGMTVDREGAIWIAFWDGWCLRRYTPDGRLAEVCALPVQRPTSCAFGGPELNALYITSARTGIEANAFADQPLAGGLFMIEPAVGGLAEVRFKGS